MKIPQIKPRGVFYWWGRLRFMYSQAVFYVGFIQMALVAAMAYNTTVQPWALKYLHWNINFWQYSVLLVALVMIGIVLEFIITVPAIIAVSNEQMYKHESPIKEDFVDIRRRLKLLMKHLNLTEEDLKQIDKDSQ
jgi:ABC-type proline/glycine betaine transport system permease subunit